jgi:pimeloyl-ACP methyl ester carboxylesterase
VGDEVLAGRIVAMAQRVGAEAYVRQQTAILSRPDSLPTLATVRCPTLVLAARQDERAPVAVHEELAAGIPGARLVVLEDCGHMAPMERPGEVTEALRQWLTAV